MKNQPKQETQWSRQWQHWSRQRQYQLQMRAEGRCILCGSHDIHKHGRCEYHYLTSLLHSRVTAAEIAGREVYPDVEEQAYRLAVLTVERVKANKRFDSTLLKLHETMRTSISRRLQESGTCGPEIAAQIVGHTLEAGTGNAPNPGNADKGQD